MEYQIIRSDRKRIALQMTSDGLIVRAPWHVSEREIKKIVAEQTQWIERSAARVQARQAAVQEQQRLTTEEVRALGEKALTYIPTRVAYYAPLVGVTYGKITIRNQKSRWGSCSSTGNLNFNCLLMLMPPEAIDAVVVHELCHRLEMNHSKAFYAQIYRVYPEYDRWRNWLKENGAAIMRRMTG